VLAISFLRFLTQLPLKSRLFAPLYISFLVLVLLIVGQQSLSLWIRVLSQRAATLVNDTLLVQREGERLLSAAIDEEMALRDYLLIKDRASIEAYSKAQTAFSNSLNRLYTLVQDDLGEQHLDEIKYLNYCWQRQIAQRAFSGFDIRFTLAGKSLLDPLRTQVLTLLQYQDILLGERNYRLQQLYQINTVVDILSTVTILTGVALNLRLLYRRVEVPLRQLTEVGEAWRMGQMKVRLDYSSPDEIGRLARVLDAMAAEVRHRQQRIEVRNQQLEDLISALSHDLRTPLLATRTTLDGMLRGAFGPVSDIWREVLEEYSGANEDLLKLVEALLDISRYEAGGGTHLSCEPLNWKKIFVRATAQISAISKGKCDLTLKISQSLPTVYGDELELQRVVQNLLDNAVRVSEPNKEIILEVAPFGEAQVQVSVRDNGPGIAPQEKERLFQRFIHGRGRRGGAGLGLYLCRQIVEAHGGTIGVKSTLGEGSTFWFTLPVDIDMADSQHKKER
jgi:signal transduction histidine kinase